MSEGRPLLIWLGFLWVGAVYGGKVISVGLGGRESLRNVQHPYSCSSNEMFWFAVWRIISRVRVWCRDSLCCRRVRMQRPANPACTVRRSGL